MNNDVLGGIGDSLEYLIGVVALNQSACGTYNCTLTAAYAGNVVQFLIERTADHGVKAAVVSADDGNILLLTSCYAATAKDTLVVVAHQMKCAVILFADGILSAQILLLVNAVLNAELLQLAVGVFGAGQAFFIVI